MPTEDYYRALKATQELHATSDKKFTGRFLLRYLEDIRKLCRDYGVRSILDWGCGKAICWKEPIEAWSGDIRVNVRLKDYLAIESFALHDPGVSEYSKDPDGKFDMVICTQALGSIPIADLPWAIHRLCGYANKVVYVGERLGKVRKRVHHDMAAAGLMPHGWSHAQWKAVLRDSKIQGWQGGPPDLWLRTKDKRAGETTLEQIQ